MHCFPEATDIMSITNVKKMADSRVNTVHQYQDMSVADNTMRNEFT